MENQQNTHSPSHLHSRLKRKVVPTATIHEDNGAQPMEIKTVKIASAESLNYQGKLVRSNKPNQANNHHSSRSKGSCRHAQSCRCHSKNHSSGCACQTTWHKIKRFVCSLFAIPTKTKESTCAQAQHKHKRRSSNRHHRRHHNTVNKHSTHE